MSVILGILKVLGILLLLLLGILLLLIILILFCPIRYRIEGVKDPSPEKEQAFSLKASAKWLMGIVGIRYDYPHPGVLKVRFLCFTLYDSSKPSKDKKKRKSDSKTSDSAVSSPKPLPEPTSDSEVIVKEESSGKATVEPATEGTQKPAQNAEKASSGKQKNKSDKPSLREKIKHFYQEFCFYKKFWNARETQELLAKVLDRFKRILRSVLPTKLEAELLVGAGEPDTTGYVMAVYGIFFSVLGNKVDITPDFERQIFEGYFKAKGHICIFTLLRHALSILLDKNLRIVYRRFKRHKAEIAKEAAESAQRASDSTESEE